jgi:Cu(I)/Ag(I) efflux system membrane fusion protein
MTSNEKKFIALGVAAGIVASIASINLYVYAGKRTFAAEKSTPLSLPTDAFKSPKADDQGTLPGTTLSLSPAEITAAGVQVADVRTAELTTSIASFGRVEEPESQLAALSARIGGRVDTLYVQYTGASVRRGQPVADIYSPEVATAIADLRLAEETRQQLAQSDDANARNQADALITASRRRLELWGISEKQIAAPEDSGTPHITIYASATGSVVDRKVTRGQYDNAGDTLFTVADLSQVWIKADVYEDQLPQIHRGQEVDITADSLPDRTIRGHVDFIEPSASPQTRTVPVHIHVANPGMRLLPGMFVNANFVSKSASESIVVPRSAVLDTGTRKIVYVAKPGGVFEAREIEVGSPSEDLFPVLRGLAKGEKVVLSGNFLIDSQAQINSDASGLYGSNKGIPDGGTTSAPAVGNAMAPASASLDLRAGANPLKAGQNNLFTATLTGADGKPIADAQVTLTFLMPGMASMGMPEMKSASSLVWDADQRAYMGNGQPAMAGSWTVALEARRGSMVLATLHTHLIAR